MLLFKNYNNIQIEKAMSRFFSHFKRAKTEPTSGSRSSDTGDPLNNEFGKKYLNMQLEEKRKLYKCGKHFVTLDNEALVTWSDMVHSKQGKSGPVEKPYPFNDKINKKVCLWKGDVTSLEIDAIVNAANRTLLGGGGVDGCIHRAAGSTLVKECEMLNGCHTGESKITSGHRLPAKYVIHTVGPMGKKPKFLESCYRTILQLVLKHQIRSIAFVGVSTGIYGYPSKDAAHVALQTVREWLQSHHEKVDKVIFCTFLDSDFDIYFTLMKRIYFPPPKLPVENSIDDAAKVTVPSSPGAVEHNETDTGEPDRKRPCENEDHSFDDGHSDTTADITETENKTTDQEIRTVNLEDKNMSSEDIAATACSDLKTSDGSGVSCDDRYKIDADSSHYENVKDVTSETKSVAEDANLMNTESSQDDDFKTEGNHINAATNVTQDQNREDTEPSQIDHALVGSKNLDDEID